MVLRPPKSRSGPRNRFIFNSSEWTIFIPYLRAKAKSRAAKDRIVKKFTGLRGALASGDTVTLKNVTKGREIKLKHGYSLRQVETILVGGTLNYTTAKAK